MKLVECHFEGLPGFARLDLDFRVVTSLVGPNGSGKSTILRVLHQALAIVKTGTLHDVIAASGEFKDYGSWERFATATLKFKSEQPLEIKRLSNHFGTSCTEIEIRIACDASKYRITQIICDGRSAQFPNPGSTRTEVQNKQRSLVDTEKQLDEANKKLVEFQRASGQRAPQNRGAGVMIRTNVPGQRQGNPGLNQANSSVATLTQSRDQQRGDLERILAASVDYGAGPQPVPRADLDAFLTELDLPNVKFIAAGKPPEVAVEGVLKELMTLKKGRKIQVDEFDRLIEELSGLLQSDVDLSESGGTERLHIDGAQHDRASSGTQISLRYFAMTRLIPSNCIVLWDEPENGLHPTRRARLLDLMFRGPLQYVLATHATEFAPIFESKGRVYRCWSEFDRSRDRNLLNLEVAADRRDAFKALEALGVHPRSTLFTANVVIWVEGPIELVFFRHWLKARLLPNGIHEGFHYTFMQYGGNLITYLEAADEGHFQSAFDLLSLCRHPFVIVDSDLRSAPANPNDGNFLKAGAKRLMNEIAVLNTQRQDAARFAWTKGREIENYLPVAAIQHAMKTLWAGYTANEAALERKALQIGPYDAYHEALWGHIVDAGVVDVDPEKPTERKPKGRSIWGEGNKVEMMQAALTMPRLSEVDLLLDGRDLLTQLEGFVSQKCDRV